MIPALCLITYLYHSLFPQIHKDTDIVSPLTTRSMFRHLNKVKVYMMKALGQEYIIVMWGKD